MEEIKVNPKKPDLAQGPLKDQQAQEPQLRKNKITLLIPLGYSLKETQEDLSKSPVSYLILKILGSGSHKPSSASAKSRIRSNSPSSALQN